MSRVNKDRDEMILGYLSLLGSPKVVAQVMSLSEQTVWDAKRRATGDMEPACLDFHHQDRVSKDEAVSRMLTWSMDKIMHEISKCIVLCSNCHRKEHYTELAE
jgi:hypothetical protein